MGTWIEISFSSRQQKYRGKVVPYVGTWIEIENRENKKTIGFVVPYVGTWIEISYVDVKIISWMRRSLRGNVDRNVNECIASDYVHVVPYVGTWIEMFMTLRGLKDGKVVPYVGTWIEMLSRLQAPE